MHSRSRAGLIWLISILLAAAGHAGQTDNARNAEAVAEVHSGKRTTANAAWWGFNEEDATDALQAAIRSGARKVIVPNLGRDCGMSALGKVLVGVKGIK